MLAFAKQPCWYKGAVVLADRQVVTGEISIDLYHDLILFRKDKKFEVYPAYKIQSFQCYDALSNINRKFVSLEDDHPVFRTFHLYESVVRGKVNVLRRPKYEISYESINSDKLDFDYYVQRDNQLTMLMHFRNKVYPELLNILGIELRHHIHKYRLNPNEASDAIKIIKFYNEHENVEGIAGII